MTEKFNIEAALNKGVEATGLAIDTFKDKYAAKFKVLKDAGTKPFNLNVGGVAKVLSVEEMAINQVISCEKAASKGDTEVLFYLEQQDDAKLTKNNKAFSNLYIIVPVGNNTDMFHSEAQTEGCVRIRVTHWNNKSFRPGFYRGKLNKSIRDGYTNYGINDIGTTERTFTVPAIAQGSPFKILVAYEPKPVMRNVKDADGQVTKGEDGKIVKEPLYKKTRDGQISAEPLMSRSMEILVLNSNGTTEVRTVSTIFDEWMAHKVDFGATYKGVLRENGPYWNLNSKPNTSNEKITIDDSMACEILADLNGVRNFAGKFVKLQPMFGDAIVEVKQNPEKGTKIGYTTISDMSANSINIIGDAAIFDSVTGPKGNLAGIVQVIGKVFINKERDTPGIRVYAIKDISSGMPSEPIKINEEPTAAENTADAW
ncbi:MAG: hypothetical protein M0R80_03565 [Proteobacteria bacterium]|jgi:hypothetical protein|nr:hypothetical protein [Pseudomonadota bacterium]